MLVTSRRIGRALVLSLSATAVDAGEGELDRALLTATTGDASASPVVFDLRDTDVLTARAARALVAFAATAAGRGVGCALVAPQASRAVDVVLDLVDRAGSVPRFTSLDRALAAHGIVAGPGRDAPLVFTSFDLGRTEEFLSSSYASMRIGSADGRTGARITRVAAGGVSVDELDLSFEMSYDVRLLGKICLCDIVSGSITGHRVAGWQAPGAFGPGELFYFAPPDRPYEGRVRDARCGITMLSTTLLDEVAGTGRPVRLLGHRPVDPTATRRLRAAIAHLRDDVLGGPETEQTPLVVASASRYLAACVLDAFPNTARTGGTSGLDAHSGTLRRAIAHIEANADRDLAATEIARAANVSVRAVQLAFRRHLGTTPMAYLRRVRLDSARAELLAASPGEITVTQIAARWGFARPSVFAAHYRTTYGESPSRTLRD